MACILLHNIILHCSCQTKYPKTRGNQHYITMSFCHKKNHVFISFRGKETRDEFTSHLENALKQQKITVYTDYRLEKGGEVWPQLVEAIEDSHMSIVVFSEAYGTSKWCLNELVKIIECREKEGQVVIPVFYKADPSDVRHQKGIYETAIEKHTEHLRKEFSSNKDIQFEKIEDLVKEKEKIDNLVKEKVSEWREALIKAANISGWHSLSTSHRDEAEFIQNIVKDVMQKLHRRFPIEPEGFLNNEAFGHMESLLKKFQVIGIWGMGGIGKSTIARVMFAKHFPQYDSSCFLENIMKGGQTYSVDKLLFNLLNEEVHTSDGLASALVKQRVGSLKFFVVLDDVKDDLLLDYLLKFLGGVHGKVRRDCRIIITARDMGILEGRVDKIYELKKLNPDESRTLFSLHAFKKEHPGDSNELSLSNKIVDYAGGNPLALKVLGSCIYNLKKPELWEDFLSQLKESPNEKIQSVLQVSYDGLNKKEQDIFLDIAFFFKEEDKDYVIRILDACGFHAALGINALVNKALISISYSNRIQMHDLLQEMGWNIVREKCGEDPREHSRLLNVKKICDVLKGKKGSDRVEGITLDLSQIEDMHLDADAFNMSKLRFLRIHLPLGRRPPKVSHAGTLKLCSENLRYFEWNGYPLKSLPPNFSAKLLVELRMPHSNVKELWQGKQDLVNLVGIDLSECKQLMKLPDLSKASKLEWIYLSGCQSLHDIYLTGDNLVSLILDGCKKLKSLKIEKHLPSLEKISVNDCSSLEEFQVSSDLVQSLDLSTTKIQVLHSSFWFHRKLLCLNLEGLRLKDLPDELSSLTSIEELRISNCIGVIDKNKLHVLCDGLRSLRKLYLKDCNKLFDLSNNIKVLSELNELRLDGSNVEKLPASIKDLPKLEILSVKNCRKLRFVPALPLSIKEFCADNCTSLVAVSTLMAFTTNMRGQKKFFSFKNCKKLDGRSLRCIVEGALFTMMSSAFHNVSVRMYESFAQRYNYNTVEVCLEGSRIPRQFTYRATRSSYITIQLPNRDNFLGFFYCVVLSPSGRMKKNAAARIQCQCYMQDGTRFSSACDSSAIGDLNSDHVYAWYDPFHSDSILSSDAGEKVRFEFSASTDNGDEHDGMIRVKECGVNLICVSDLNNCLFDQESSSELDPRLRLGMALDLMQRYAVLESRLLALENGLEPGIALKVEFESRRRAMLALIEKESNGTSGTEDNCSLSGGGLVSMKIFSFTILACVVLNKIIKKSS